MYFLFIYVFKLGFVKIEFIDNRTDKSVIGLLLLGHLVYGFLMVLLKKVIGLSIRH